MALELKVKGLSPHTGSKIWDKFLATRQKGTSTAKIEFQEQNATNKRQLKGGNVYVGTNGQGECITRNHKGHKLGIHHKDHLTQHSMEKVLAKIYIYSITHSKEGLAN